MSALASAELPPATRRGLPFVMYAYLTFALFYYAPALWAPERKHGMPVMPLWHVLLRDAVWAALCAVTVLYWLRHRKESPWRLDRAGRWMVAVLVTAGVIVLGTAALQVPHRGPLSVMQHDVRNLVMYGGIIAMVPVWLPHRASITKLWGWLWALILAAAAVAVSQVLVLPQTTWLTRATSILNNPNNLGWVCVLGLVMGAGRTAAGLAAPWPALLFGGILVAGVATSQSIAGHTNLAVSCVVALLLAQRARRRALLGYLLGSVMIGLGLGVVLGSTPLMMAKIWASVGPNASRRTVRAREEAVADTAEYVRGALGSGKARRLLIAAADREDEAEQEQAEEGPLSERFLRYSDSARQGEEGEGFRRNESVYLNLLYNDGLLAAGAVFLAVLSAAVLAVRRTRCARRAGDPSAEAVALAAACVLLTSAVVSFNLNPVLYRFPVNVLTYLLIGLTIYGACQPSERKERAPA